VSEGLIGSCRVAAAAVLSADDVAGVAAVVLRQVPNPQRRSDCERTGIDVLVAEGSKLRRMLGSDPRRFRPAALDVECRETGRGDRRRELPVDAK